MSSSDDMKFLREENERYYKLGVKHGEQMRVFYLFAAFVLGVITTLLFIYI